MFDDAAGERLGLNQSDLRCLDWLWDGPKSIGELSTATALSSPATTTLIDRLEEKGFARRTRQGKDRRRVLVELTAAGRERLLELWGPLITKSTKLMNRMTDAELRQLRDFLVAARELTDRERIRIAR